MTNTSSIDAAKVEAFSGKVLNDSSASFVTILAAFGDRLGLFKSLATNGPSTSAQLALHASIDERYAREWLGGMTAAGYLTHDAGSGRFALPSEHAPALAEEGGPYFFGGAYVSAGAKISIIPVEKSATLGGRQPGLILDSEEGRMCSGGATWKRLLI